MNTDTLVLVVARHSSKSVFPGLKCFSSFLDFIFAWLTCVGTEWLFDMCSNVIFQTLHRSELQLMAHLIGYWGGGLYCSHRGSYRLQGHFWRFPIPRNATLTDTRLSSTTRHTEHIVTLKNRDWGNMSWFLLRYSFLRVTWLFLTSRFFPFLASLSSFFLLPWWCWD